MLSNETARTQPTLKPYRRRGEAGFLERYVVFAILAAAIAVFWVLAPSTFGTAQNASTIIGQQTVGLLAALALLIPLVVGEYDMSVGYTAGFAGIVAAKVGAVAGGATAIAVVVLAALIIGAVNGYLVVYRRINSLIVTLGVGFVISGLSIGFSGSSTISVGIPELILAIPTTEVLGFGMDVWIVVALIAVVYLVLARTPLGREMYAVGSNERVAKLAGVRTDRMRVGAFMASALVASVAGIMQLGIAGAALPSFGSNLLLPAFAGVFLGSTFIDPGRFNVMGTVLASLLLAVGFSGLSLLGADFWVQPVFSGLVLIGAVLLSQVRRARSLKV